VNEEAHMTRSILLFSYPGDILSDYSLKNGKVPDVIERLLANINEELENEHGNHNHSSPFCLFSGQLNTTANTVIP
jgi:hypothetical protein